MTREIYSLLKPMEKEREKQAISQIGVEQKQEIIPQAQTQFDAASLSQQHLILDLQKKESIIQHILQEKEAAIQEKEYAIQEKEYAIQEKEYAIQEKETAIQAREAITQNHK